MSVQQTIADCIRVVAPALDVAWQDRKSAWRAEKSVTLRVISVPRIGVDERRAAIQGTGIRERLHGNRLLRLQMIINTDDQDLLDSAQDYADQILMGFSRSDIEQSLSLACLGVPVAGPILITNAPDEHGDQRSIAIVELTFPWSRTVTGALLPRIDVVEIGSRENTFPQTLPFSFDNDAYVPSFTVDRDQ